MPFETSLLSLLSRPTRRRKRSEHNNDPKLGESGPVVIYNRGIENAISRSLIIDELRERLLGDLNVAERPGLELAFDNDRSDA